MKKLFSVVFLIVCVSADSQTLTVEKIMGDPKWIGTSPSAIVWSYDSKSIIFNWNPEKAKIDSSYQYSLNSKMPVKLNYNDAQVSKAISNGSYNLPRTKITFTYLGDIYLLDIASRKSIRITQTEENESDPSFVIRGEAIAFQSGKNLFLWTLSTGTTRQLTDFEKEKPSVKKPSQQDVWLQQEQPRTSEIVKQRKEKKEARTAYLESMKDRDSIHVFYTGDKSVQNLHISPDARFITYSLVEEAANAKTSIVPDFLSETGYTTEIRGRSKVGAPERKSQFYSYDRLKDTVILVKTDSLPGISDKPDYIKDYPAKLKDTARASREVYVREAYWNEEGTNVFLDIFSQDFKDRWLMQLDPASGKLKLLDRQRDEAWIAGPGIGWSGGRGNAGWINDHTLYFQSEATGFSHLYSYDLTTHTKKPITQGQYEIQQAILSHDKKFFYVVSNEEHPGKQNFYRMDVNGSNKQKLTTMTGTYEVSLSPNEKFIAFRYSYQNKPWELFVQATGTNAKPIQVTDKAMSDEWNRYAWRDTKIVTFKNRDSLLVYTRIYEPPPGKKNNAAVIFVHGAGYLQNVTYGWSSSYYHEYMFNNLLADKGYTVIDIDYRASAGYGRNWRTAIYRYMGGKDLDDEVDAAKYLVKEHGIDSARIGMYGGSYGGFMTLMALFTQPNVIRAGAALRPVTDWGHYNHPYTAAILNQPFNDTFAYQRSSPINFAAGLKNHLLICHGMVDVTVHYQDAARLAQRLIELGKDNWQLASYPVEDHAFVEPSSWTDEYKRIVKLFDETLLK